MRKYTSSLIEYIEIICTDKNTYQSINKIYPKSKAFGRDPIEKNLEMSFSIDSQSGIFDTKNGNVLIHVKFTKEFANASFLL